MLESQLQSAVIDHASKFGWKVAHFRPGMNQRGRWLTAVQGDGAGFPDLILARGARLLAIELKQDKRYPSPAQKAWLGAFDEAGVETHVWRPADWPENVHKALRYA